MLKTCFLTFLLYRLFPEYTSSERYNSSHVTARYKLSFY